MLIGIMNFLQKLIRNLGLLALLALFPQTKVMGANCFRVIESFFEEVHLDQRIAFPIRTGSIFDQYPEIVSRFEKLSPLHLDLSDYYRTFRGDFERAPTLKEAIEFVFDHKRRVVEEYDVLIYEIRLIQKELPFHDSRLDSFLDELYFSRKKLDNFKTPESLAEEIKSSYKAGKSSISDINVSIRLSDDSEFLLHEDFFQFLNNQSGYGNIYGEYGELLAFGATDERIFARSLAFKSDNTTQNIYQKNILKKVANFEESLERMEVDQMIRLTEKYGDNLLRIAKKYIDETPRARIEHKELRSKIFQMISNKEIDMVTRQKNGLYVWSEVKARRAPITLKSLTESRGKKKSMLDQIQEHLQLRDILGLQDKVRLRFVVPTSQVDKAARDKLELLGVEVISSLPQ